jgi:hypothetical protein
VLAHEYAGEDSVPVFDARFLKGGAARLDWLVRLHNTHRFNVDDLMTGMFWYVSKEDKADHTLSKIDRPDRFLSSASEGEIVRYGERGKKINAADAANQERKEAAV